MTIRIVTDSTADLTPEMAEAYGVTIVPLTVTFGDDDTIYEDNVDLDNETFYQKLRTSKSLPRTSQPSPAKYQEIYTRLIEEGADGIISIHMSSKLSGSYQSATTARDTLPEEIKKVPIEIIDSQTVSLGIFLGVKRAVEWAREGQSLEEVKANVIEVFQRISLFAMLDTLEYAKRGGRISGAKALVGNMLSVKPIISLKDGAVIALEQPRTRSKALTRLTQIALENGPLEEMIIVEADETIGNQLEEVLKATGYKEKIKQYKIGAALGTHAGPGAGGYFIVKAK